MSAVLLLPAFRHRIGQVSHAKGGRDPANLGVMPPGGERVRDNRAGVALKDRTHDDARLLFRSGEFAAASR